MLPPPPHGADLINAMLIAPLPSRLTPSPYPPSRLRVDRSKHVLERVPDPPDESPKVVGLVDVLHHLAENCVADGRHALLNLVLFALVDVDGEREGPGVVGGVEGGEDEAELVASRALKLEGETLAVGDDGLGEEIDSLAFRLLGGLTGGPAWKKEGGEWG